MDFVASVFSGARIPIKHDRIYVELTDWVTRDYYPWHRRVYRWFSFATGETQPIFESSGEFEVEPGYALFMARGGDVSIYFQTFSVDPEVIVALDVARDAMLENRGEGTRIARAAMPHGNALFLALIQKEKNLGS